MTSPRTHIVSFLFLSLHVARLMVEERARAERALAGLTPPRRPRLADACFLLARARGKERGEAVRDSKSRARLLRRTARRRSRGPSLVCSFPSPAPACAVSGDACETKSARHTRARARAADTR